MKAICFRITLALAFLTLRELVAARPHAAHGALLWQQNVNGTANDFDQAISVAVDNQGNVVAAGANQNSGTSGDFTVAKFDRDGTLLWQQNLNGTANFTTSDAAHSVAVDNQGNVVAAGVTVNTGTSDDFTVAKFDRDGTLLWQQNLNGTANTNNVDVALSVAVDNQGNVVAAGFTLNSGTFADFTVAKFDRDGTLLWQQNLSGTAANSFDDAARSVTVDNQGNVVAAGYTQNTGTSVDFTVAKFNRNGTLLWQQNLNGTANSDDDALSVAVDNHGNVVTAGVTQNSGTSGDFTVAKFDRDGTLLWQQNLNGTANSFDAALSVAVDNQGNVVAAGFTLNSGTFADFTVAKFDRDGTLLWQQNLNGTANSRFDVASSVAVDNQGNVVAAGFTHNSGTADDFTVAKFDRDGTLLWQQNLNGTANSFDQAVSVAVDNQGNVVAAGATQNSGTSGDFTVAKFGR